MSEAQQGPENLWLHQCKALFTERDWENPVQGLGKEATDSWVFDSGGNAIIMIIFRDLRKAFDTEGRTILLSKLSLSFRIESKYSLLVVHSPKPVPSNVVSPKGIYSVLYVTFVTQRPFCPERLTKLWICTASLVLAARLAVQIQSFF